VMPRTTPAIKVEGVKSRGGQVVLHGDAFDEAYAHASMNLTKVATPAARPPPPTGTNTASIGAPCWRRISR
jgi:hypothetical protein